jgi:urease accessory protein
MRFLRRVIVLLLLTSGSAWAHAPIAGMDSFMNGVLHPLIIPAQVLLLVSLGLLLGRQGDKAIGSILPVFLLSLLLSAGLSLIRAPLPEWLLLVMALGLALWLISGRAMIDRLLWVSALVAAFLIGTDSLIEEFSDRERYFALVGSCLGGYVLLLYSAGIAESLRRFQNGIVLRILGSWIAASIMLVLSLAFIGEGGQLY